MSDLAHWKAEQARVWGAAPGQDIAESVLSAVHEELVSRIAPHPGERWLDLATGTGAVALRAARAGAEVSALDLSPVLVDTARRLAAQQGLAIRFEVGDAERLQYPDASFDFVSSAHGVVLAADHLACELARVCRAGGRLGLTYWRSHPELEQLMDRIGYARPPHADNPRDWRQPRYVNRLLGADFELEFVEAACASQKSRVMSRGDLFRETERTGVSRAGGYAARWRCKMPVDRVIQRRPRADRRAREDNPF